MVAVVKLKQGRRAYHHHHYSSPLSPILISVVILLVLCTTTAWVGGQESQDQDGGEDSKNFIAKLKSFFRPKFSSNSNSNSHSTKRNSNNNNNNDNHNSLPPWRRSALALGVPQAAYMSTPELIRFHGYPVEEVKVVTPDGYILTIFRIPHGKDQGKNVKKKEPVLLWHGFLSSSNDWLLVPNFEDNLPYLLANEGHEVWLGNQRGNNFSLDHVNGLRADRPEFFNFGYDEMGKQDVPSVIATILEKSNAIQISYVGHSLGCSLAVIAINEYPQLNHIIKKMTFLAPGIYIEHYRRLWAQIMALVPENVLHLVWSWVTDGRVIPRRMNYLVNTIGAQICHGSLGAEFCNVIIFLISGFDKAQMTNVTASLVAGHTPNGASVKTVIQGLQVYKKKKLQKFDYGPQGNLGLYGFKTPPAYSLSKVKVPVQGFYGPNDALVRPQDVLRVFRELGNVAELNRVDDDNWTHLDFMYAKDVKYYVYDRIVKFMSTY